MENIYNHNKLKFIRQYSSDKFERLYDKVANSKATISLIGHSANRSLAPNPADFLGSANMIPYVVSKFNIGISVMAALIMLKIWNERINIYHRLTDEYRMAEIAEKIAARWI